jgi:hypothetical protein
MTLLMLSASSADYSIFSSSFLYISQKSFWSDIKKYLFVVVASVCGGNLTFVIGFLMALLNEIWILIRYRWRCLTIERDIQIQSDR